MTKKKVAMLILIVEIRQKGIDEKSEIELQ